MIAYHIVLTDKRLEILATKSIDRDGHVVGFENVKEVFGVDVGPDDNFHLEAPGVEPSITGWDTPCFFIPRAHAPVRPHASKAGE